MDRNPAAVHEKAKFITKNQKTNKRKKKQTQRGSSPGARDPKSNLPNDLSEFDLDKMIEVFSEECEVWQRFTNL